MNGPGDAGPTNGKVMGMPEYDVARVRRQPRRRAATLSCRFGCTPCGVGWDRVIMDSWDMRLGLGGILPRGRAPLDRSLDECTVRKESVGAALPATARRLMVGSHARAFALSQHRLCAKKTVESASWPLSEGQVG